MSSEHKRTKSLPVHMRAPCAMQAPIASWAVALVPKRLKQTLLSSLHAKLAGESTIAPSGLETRAFRAGKVAGVAAERQHRQVA
eukprot:scaffold1377_cov220-Pinguiococcus_pyrenoidosus.AAC.6